MSKVFICIFEECVKELCCDWQNHLCLLQSLEDDDVTEMVLRIAGSKIISECRKKSEACHSNLYLITLKRNSIHLVCKYERHFMYYII